MGRIKNEIGNRYGSLLVISQSDKKRIQNFLKEPIEINSEDKVPTIKTEVERYKE